MAALPQGAFVACKLRDQYRDRDLMVSRIKSGGDKNESKFYNGNKKCKYKQKGINLYLLFCLPISMQFLF